MDNCINYIGRSIVEDSLMNLLNWIMLILSYSDPNACILISESEDRIVGHITASKPEFRDEIISNILYINRTLKVKIEYSKSLKISNTISFTINKASLTSI